MRTGTARRQARLALLALQLALTTWWRRVKIAPDLVLGQGVGEFAAAAAAGILTAEEVLRLAVDGHRDNGDSPYDRLQPRPASLPFLSSVDGKLHAGPDLDAAHWQSCVRGPAGHGRGDGGTGRPENRPLPGIARGDRLAFRGTRMRDSPAGDVELGTAVATLYAAGADFPGSGWHPAPGVACACPRIPGNGSGSGRRARTDWRDRPPPRDLPPSQGLAAEPAVAAEVRGRPDLTAPYVAPRTPLETEMAESWSAILRIEGIGVHDNFFELGGDSLQATILLNRLEENLGEGVPGHVLFQVQTINDLANYLREHCPDAVRRRYPDEAVAPAAEPGDASPSRKAANAGGDVSIPRLARDQQAEDLLARLDELSDEEVESLLGEAAGDGEADHERPFHFNGRPFVARSSPAVEGAVAEEGRGVAEFPAFLRPATAVDPGSA